MKINLELKDKKQYTSTENNRTSYESLTANYFFLLNLNNIGEKFLLEVSQGLLSAFTNDFQLKISNCTFSL